ncbi:MAG: hypothetical protein Q7R68_10860 [Nitrospirales bacterium]|nr:hypothetical protein [Nitrospirales bacterium]
MIILTAKREAFCLLLVAGKTLNEAYRQSRPAGVMNDQTAQQRAKELLRNPQILRRIAEIRLPAVQAFRKTYEYKLEHALAECNEAHALAMSLGQPSVMVTAIQLKAKLAGLIVDKKEERHGLLDDVTTRDLLRMRAELKAREAVVRNEVIDMVEDSSEKTVRESDRGGVARFSLPAMGPTVLDRS